MALDYSDLSSFPSHWEIKSIKEFAKVKGGKRLPLGKSLTPNKTIHPYIRIVDIRDGRVDKSNLLYVPEDVYPEISRYIIGINDIYISIVGTIGLVGVIDADLDGANLTENAAKICEIDHSVDRNFLAAYLQSGFGQHEIMTQTVGSTQPKLALFRIGEIRVPIPPLPEQRRIADVLGALDDKIELNRRMNFTLEAIARAVFKEWFVDSAEYAEWEYSSLGELFPDDKECVLTGPFGSHLHAHDYRATGTPILLVKNIMYGNIVEDGIPLVGDHKLPDVQRYQLRNGDIVFTRVGAVGRSAYIYPRHAGWLISGQTLRVRIPDNRKLNPRYLAQVYLEPSFINMVESYALGTTRPSLNTSILKSFGFTVPPIEIQNKFAEIALSLDEKNQNNNAENRTLAALRDALLPRLMRGEVRVKPG